MKIRIFLDGDLSIDLGVDPANSEIGSASAVDRTETVTETNVNGVVTRTTITKRTTRTEIVRKVEAK